MLPLAASTMAAPPCLSNAPISKHNKEEDENMIILERYKERVSNLPKEKGWGLADHMYKYQGFWYNSPAWVQGLMAIQDRFHPQPSDILLVTNPKCGTTWLKALTFAIINRNKYKNSISTHPLLSTNPHHCVPFLNDQLFLFNPSADVELQTLPSPRLFATHTPCTSLPESVFHSGCRLVYVCRNPKDKFVSLWQFMNKQRASKGIPPTSLGEAFDYFSKGISPMGPYWDHVLGYYKASLKHPKMVLFLKYEDMKSETLENVKRLASFMGYPFTIEEEAGGVVQEIIELCTFENLSNLEVNKDGICHENVTNDMFFRKGKVADSVNYLTTEMIDRLDRITEEKFHGFDLLSF